ncbi:MAG: hypothetical protein LBQ64_01150 [Bacteroidales bacterium]|jgi:hypothetical protein|nr:hypothetical protein [Bacteroidales bacterium]
MRAKISLLLVVFLLGYSSWTQAQEKDKAQENEKIRYSNLSEFGCVAGSPYAQGIATEVTFVNGVSIDRQHHFGIGIGIGGAFYRYSDETMYTPVFFNYRLYFKPKKLFSPHINATIGGLLFSESGGLVTSFTSGFKAGNFSFASGLTLMMFQGSEYVDKEYRNYDPYLGRDVVSWRREKDTKMRFPFGITIKIGLTF